jgi:hypothetical protein
MTPVALEPWERIRGPAESDVSLGEVFFLERIGMRAVAQRCPGRQIGVPQRIGDEPDSGAGFENGVLQPLVGTVSAKRAIQILFEPGRQRAQAGHIEQRIGVAEQRLARPVLVCVHQLMDALDPLVWRRPRLRFRRDKPESAPGADGIADHAVGVVGLLEEASVAAQKRFGKGMGPRRIEGEKLAFDLVEPGFDLQTEAARGSPRQKAPGPLPALQPRAERLGERGRFGGERVTGEPLLDRWLGGGQFRKQRGQLLFREVSQRFQTPLGREVRGRFLCHHVR